MTVKTKPNRQSVFISGPYRSKWGLAGVIWNIFKAWRAGRKLVREGYSVFVPHLNTALMDGLQPVDFFLNCCLKELPNFEVIYMMRGWEKSEGAREELAEARRRGLKVVYWHEEILKAERDKIIQAFGIPESILGMQSKPIIEDCTQPVNVTYKLEPQEGKE